MKSNKIVQTKALVSSRQQAAEVQDTINMSMDVTLSLLQTYCSSQNWKERTLLGII